MSKITKCQICYNDLYVFFNVGYLPPVNTMVPVGSRLDESIVYPAELLHCSHCRLVQLGYEAKQDIVFPPTYSYTSGTTKLLRDNFYELCQEAMNAEIIKPKEIILDIGSNDGTLLKNFKDAGCYVYGVEPTNACYLASEAGIPTFNTFFDSKFVKTFLDANGGIKAQLITACNVFAHIPSIHEVIDNILSILKPGGVFVCENHYFPSLLSTLQYDTIYHEHLRYYSLSSLQYLFSYHGMEIIKAKKIPTHGGSIRVYVMRKDEVNKSFPKDDIYKILEEEKTHDTLNSLEEFNNKVSKSKLELLSLINSCKQNNSKICAIGCPSRAVTFIHYVGLDESILEYVCEIKGSKKIDHFVPGTLIPIVDEDVMYMDNPEYALLLSWHLADELIPKIKAKGYQGKFIVPLPTPRVI